jgi:hypothetical protein
MRRSVLTILLFCLTISLTRAQLWKLKRWEAVAGIGPSLFFGDVGGYSRTKNILGIRDMSFLQTRFNVNAGGKYRITREINLRISMTYALLHATDERGSNEFRQLESSTSVFEPAVIGEYYFIKNYAENSYLFLKSKKLYWADILRSLDFYAFTGIGGNFYKVKPNEELASLGLKTGGVTAVIPVGFGSNLIFSPNFDLGLEIGGRYTFTDYMDGYHSQFSKANDVYYFFNLTFIYKLKTGPNGLPVFRR